MTNVNGRDDNGYPIMWGVSHRDGITPVQIKFTSDREIMVDRMTAIEFDPEIDASVVPLNVPLIKATASETYSDWAVENQTIRPLVVNADTGAVLTDPGDTI